MTSVSRRVASVCVQNADRSRMATAVAAEERRDRGLRDENRGRVRDFFDEIEREVSQRV